MLIEHPLLLLKWHLEKNRHGGGGGIFHVFLFKVIRQEVPIMIYWCIAIK